MLAAMLLCAPAALHGESVGVIGGETSVAFDDGALGDVGLTVSGVSSDVQSPGALPNSVGFAINSRTDSTQPTTATYDPDDFAGTFSGTIEHSGSVFFNDDTVEAGDFSIGFDSGRAGTLDGQASGFFVASNAGLNGVLFDLASPSELTATNTDLVIQADLLTSPEFSQTLEDAALVDDDVSGSNVGEARVDATAVPSPSALGGGLGLLGLLAWRRRRSVM
jgi:hypothetical protein